MTTHDQAADQAFLGKGNESLLLPGESYQASPK